MATEGRLVGLDGPTINLGFHTEGQKREKERERERKRETNIKKEERQETEREKRDL